METALQALAAARNAYIAPFAEAQQNLPPRADGQDNTAQQVALDSAVGPWRVDSCIQGRLGSLGLPGSGFLANDWVEKFGAAITPALVG